MSLLCRSSSPKEAGAQPHDIARPLFGPYVVCSLRFSSCLHSHEHALHDLCPTYIGEERYVSSVSVLVSFRSLHLALTCSPKSSDLPHSLCTRYGAFIHGMHVASLCINLVFLLLSGRRWVAALVVLDAHPHILQVYCAHLPHLSWVMRGSEAQWSFTSGYAG